jgi:hypothetical protein
LFRRLGQLEDHRQQTGGQEIYVTGLLSAVNSITGMKGVAGWPQLLMTSA